MTLQKQGDNTIWSFQQEDTVGRSPHDKLHQYLQSDLKTTTDVLGWWGVSQYLFECRCVTKGTSPPPDIWTLKRITWDYLAIQGSATPSEHAFSSRCIMGCPRWSQLKPNIFEALQLLKSADWNGHISASTQVELHMEEFIKSLDSLCDTDTDSE